MVSLKRTVSRAETYSIISLKIGFFSLKVCPHPHPPNPFLSFLQEMPIIVEIIEILRTYEKGFEVHN